MVSHNAHRDVRLRSASTRRPRRIRLAETATNTTNRADATALAEEGTVLLRNGGGNLLPLGSRDRSVAVIGADASSSPQTAGAVALGSPRAAPSPPLQGTHRRGAQRGDRQGITAAHRRASAATLATASSTVAIVFASYPESRRNRPDQHRSGNCARLTHLRGGSRQPAHDRGTEHRVSGHDAVAVLGHAACSRPGIRANRMAQPSPRSCSAGADPSGHLPVTFPTCRCPRSSRQYRSSVAGYRRHRGLLRGHLNVGYRWYQARHLTPQFPFGYGEYHQLLVQQAEDRLAFRAGGAATDHRDRYRYRPA